MPKRTTPRQRMIAMVREHLAGPGVAVTESKMLRDSVTGTNREVDVVIEGEMGGEHLIVSVEVIDQKRPATIEWVEQMMAKHVNLPTNRLVLVSWSGFSKRALQKADAAAGRVFAGTPERLLDEHGSERYSKHLFVDQISLTTRECRLTLRRPDDSIVWVRAMPDFKVYDAKGTEVGTVEEIARAYTHAQPTLRRLSEQAHQREDREQLKTFVLGDDGFNRAELFLRFEEGSRPELHRIERVSVIGDFSFAQTELSFAVMQLAGNVFGSTTAPMLGRDAVWVASPNPDNPDELKISWQAIGNASDSKT